MIQGISSANAYFSPTILSINGVGAGKRSIPVRPADSLFLFKHVLGVPARSSESQVSIDKLRVLDNLIDRLVRLRGEKGEVMPVTRDNVDGLIQQFQSELHTAVAASKPMFTTGLSPETGLVINLLA
jgi:hypothetical protein